jgi:hypothetical protein
MRVILDGSVFGPAGVVYLPVFFWLGMDDRHRIALRDSSDERYSRWLNSQSQEWAQDWQELVDICDQSHALEPSALSITVAAIRDSQWAMSPPTLSLRDALTLLTAPYWVLVENAVNDRGFFLAILEREEREFVERLERDERVQFEHGGGTDMLRRITLARPVLSRALRTSVLFDSDALEPGAPSPESDRKVRACGDMHYHRLSARSIENYIPLDALSRWASGNKNREKLLSAFCRFTTQQRDYYNMKAGFSGDSRHVATAGML